ncbi:MAG: hypothetical protein KGS72_07005 [Cyanobacteria bacterium REEB67]|nr:hypothetical protein [Cyanobacteria bacterium REEB67]
MKKPQYPISAGFDRAARRRTTGAASGCSGNACQLSRAFTLLIIGVALQSSNPAMALDWGYDEIPAAKASMTGPGPAALPANPKGTKIKANSASGRQAATVRAKTGSETAPDETSLNSPGPQSRRESEKEVAAKEPTPQEIAAREKTRDLRSWMQIYALAASSASEDDRNQILGLNTLNEGLRKKLEKSTFEKLETDVPQYKGVSAIWQPISVKVVADIDYKESYRLLFRSLLRHALGHMDQSSSEAEPLHEILGPTRIAEMGPPILTEDAINAYSEMTCFLYAKNHPDHTLEGDDNKQLFADVIRQRYHDAPNPEAKKAMCNFDLTWAAFRCRYLDSSESEKAKLLASISAASVAPGESAAAGPRPARGETAKGRGGQGMSPSPRMLKIFAIGPWAEKIIAAATPAQTATAEKLDMSKPLTSEASKAKGEAVPTKTTPVAAKMNQRSEPTK